MKLVLPFSQATCSYAMVARVQVGLGTCKGHLHKRLVAEACLHAYLCTGGLQQAGVFRLQSRV